METITLTDGWAPAPAYAIVKDHLGARTVASVPEPGEGEILVRMKLSPIHNLDLIHCAGVLRGPPSSGCEGLGVVEQVGRRVTGVSRGDRLTVLAWPLRSTPERILAFDTRIALWSEYVVCGPDHVFPAPDVADADAALAYMNPMSAWAMVVDVLAAKAGEWLALSGASSSLALAVNQIARARGVRIVNLVRNAGHVDPLRKLGYEHVLAYDEAHPAAVAGPILELTRGGVHGAIDLLGGALPGTMLNALRPFGTLISVGTSSARGMDLSDLMTAGRFMMEGKQIHGFSVNKSWAASRSTELKVRAYAEVRALLESGVLVSPATRVFAFADVRAAVEHAGANANCLGSKALLAPHP